MHSRCWIRPPLWARLLGKWEYWEGHPAGCLGLVSAPGPGTVPHSGLLAYTKFQPSRTASQGSTPPGLDATATHKHETLTWDCPPRQHSSLCLLPAQCPALAPASATALALLRHPDYSECCANEGFAGDCQGLCCHLPTPCITDARHSRPRQPLGPAGQGHTWPAGQHTRG